MEKTESNNICDGTSITSKTRAREREKETKRMPAPMPHEVTGGKEYFAEQREA